MSAVLDQWYSYVNVRYLAGLLAHVWWDCKATETTFPCIGLHRSGLVKEIFI